MITVFRFPSCFCGGDGEYLETQIAQQGCPMLVHPFFRASCSSMQAMDLLSFKTRGGTAQRLKPPFGLFAGQHKGHHVFSCVCLGEPKDKHV